MFFYFKLTDGSTVEEVDGLELSDLAAAREEAMGLAHDLARMDLLRRDRSNWTVIVTDENGHQVLAITISENPAGN